MRERLYKIIVLSSLFLLMGAATPPTPPHFDITGLDASQKKNVEHRLTDLYAHPTGHVISEAKLRYQVEQALTPYGFFEPRITVTLPTKKKPGHIHVIPGPKLMITHLNVTLRGEGHDNRELQQTYHNLPLQQGTPFSSIAYEEAKTNLLNAAEHEGYLHARFEEARVLIDKAHLAAHITLHFNTGKRSYFGIIHFKTGKIRPALQPKNDIQLPRLSKILGFFNPSGNRYSPFSSKPIPLADSLLYRYAPFQYDTPYSPDALMTFNSNLTSSGYFRTIDIKPGEAQNHHVPLNVNLEPTDRFSYSLSGGYGTDTGARGRVGLHIIPLNAAGHKLDVVGQGSSNQNAAQMKYTIPGYDPVHEQYTINGGFNNLNYVSGNSQAGRFSLVYQNIRPRYKHILSLNGLHEAFRYDQQDPSEKTVVYPKATLAWRQASSPLFSPSGYNITVTGFAGTRAVFSSISVAELTVDAKAAYTIDFIRTRFYAHTVQGITQVNDIYKLPLSLALLLGGPETMKGYSYNSIGPGKLLSYGGIEVQKETLSTWYVLGFIDKGTVFKPDPKLVQYDIGVGLMWRSPVGPIKMAIAQPTNSRLRAMPDTGIRFVVNMGPDI